MANAFYDLFLEECLDASNNLVTLDIKCVLVDLADYTFSAAHEDLADILIGARIETTANLITKTIVDGVFDAADTLFASASGDEAEAVVVYIDSGVEATSRLMVFMDSASAGLPVQPNGGDINLIWGANIFSL